MYEYVQLFPADSPFTVIEFFYNFIRATIIGKLFVALFALACTMALIEHIRTNYRVAKRFWNCCQCGSKHRRTEDFGHFSPFCSDVCECKWHREEIA